ncbi:amidase [Rhodococcoides kyotonense]|uniref:Amidase/aspartyl-tRNA(Asn)/glutamyl-tRNA(Gln) amidotransferase subunit A n=1 Tax=Rhodococcoides kyotonense TaxID=398843 RepID=A0A239INI8_9NOCA|nr:amidase [Rhodococcus kyotonensis]SNS95111.1 amidase/aspartyl-tRNA(Asn)/glutamyl-tRNA(Gln) amidotransferase subunit A [Rhodococcus kyotonensis]
MTDPLLTKSTAELRASFASGESTPNDVLDATLDHIATTNPLINAMAFVDEAGARRAAQGATERIEAGRPLSDLDGIPVTIKDSINAVGMPWRHGVLANKDLPMSTVDAPPAARLKEAGAVILGKTTMPDMGMMAAGVSSLYGITRNPWDLTRNTGGSSSGAGASLASGIGFVSVGSDIAGSVRLPAGHCGLVALKPTQGRIPHLAPSTMRSAGPMARTVDDLIDLYRIITRPDPRDTWGLPHEDTADILAPLAPAGLRIGVMLDMGYGTTMSDDVLHVVRSAASQLQAAGAVVTEMPPIFGEDPYPALDRLFQVRARTEWESIPESRRSEVLPAVADWASGAANYTAAQFSRDTDAVMRAQEIMRAKTSEFDFVISPVIPTVGFGAEEVGLNSAQPLAHCSFTAWFNQTAQPASALCFGFAEHMPVGIQVAGPRFADQAVLRLTKWLEGAREFDIVWPTDVAAQKIGATA